MVFNESDLYFAIHNSRLKVEGSKINIHDRYDYSKRKSLEEYYNDTASVPKSIFSSTLYNLAYYSVKFNVMKEYDIDINFELNEYEVI